MVAGKTAFIRALLNKLDIEFDGDPANVDETFSQNSQQDHARAVEKIECGSESFGAARFSGSESSAEKSCWQGSDGYEQHVIGQVIACDFRTRENLVRPIDL